MSDVNGTPDNTRFEQSSYKRFASRKLLMSLLAMVSATVLVYIGSIQGEVWGSVVTLVVGSYQVVSWRAKKDGVD